MNKENLTVLFGIIVVYTFVNYKPNQYRHSSQSIPSTNKDYEQNYKKTQQEHQSYPNRRGMIGTWIGNTWIPPEGWKLFSTAELKDHYRGKNILFIGDSLVRRVGMTLYQILNSTNDDSDIPVSVVDDAYTLNLNRANRIQEPCTRWQHLAHRPLVCRYVINNKSSNDSYATIENSKAMMSSQSLNDNNAVIAGQIVQIWTPCLRDLQKFLDYEISGKSNITADMDLIIVALGAHESHPPYKCRRDGAVTDVENLLLKNTTDKFYIDMQKDTLHVLERVIYSLFLLKARAPHLDIVWRTSGFSQNDINHYKEETTYAMNNLVMDVIDEKNFDTLHKNNYSNNQQQEVTYVNWGGAIERRSFNEKRIEGDTEYHYGLEPRLVLIQMITNVLIENSKIK